MGHEFHELTQIFIFIRDFTAKTHRRDAESAEFYI